MTVELDIFNSFQNHLTTTRTMAAQGQELEGSVNIVSIDNKTLRVSMKRAKTIWPNLDELEEQLKKSSLPFSETKEHSFKVQMKFNTLITSSICAQTHTVAEKKLFQKPDLSISRWVKPS